MKKNNLNENTLKRLIRSILLENDSEIKDIPEVNFVNLVPIGFIP